VAATIFNGNFIKALKNRLKTQNDAIVPGWLNYEVDYLDLQTAATNNTVDLHEILARGMIQKVAIDITQGFQGGSITEVELSLGPNTNLDKHVPPTSIYNPNTLPEVFVVDEIESMSSDVFTRMDVNSTGANLSDLSQGLMNIHLLMSGLANIAE